MRPEPGGQPLVKQDLLSKPGFGLAQTLLFFFLWGGLGATFVTTQLWFVGFGCGMVGVGALCFAQVVGGHGFAGALCCGRFGAKSMPS